MIAIITYNVPHRKTQDIISKLLLNGYTDLHLVAIPFIHRKKQFKPIYQHRPNTRVDISVEKLCHNLNLGFSKVDVKDLYSFFNNNHFDHIIIGGAGLLPDELVLNHNIINAHPGYIPIVKGLDALKWAIYHGHPIGVTTHYIDNHADEGKLIDKKTVPVYFEDTFHSLAYRVYETEIEMLVDAIKLIENNQATFEPLKDDRYQANKRMPHRLEIIMMSRFEELRKKSPSKE